MEFQDTPQLPPLPKLQPDIFTNREISNIHFNARVLALAKDPSIPLLERLKFIAIVGNNMDEFFMVRVASYIQKIKLGLSSKRADGYTPTQLVNTLRAQILDLMRDQRATMSDLLRMLEDEGIRILKCQNLNPQDQEAVRQYFHEEVFPVLTPLAADHARPFPFISNLSLNIGIFLQHVHLEDPLDKHSDFVRIKVPDTLSRLVDLGKIKAGNSEPYQFLWLEDVIAANLDLLFPGMSIIEQHPFRVTRNADIDYEHEQDEELFDLSTIIEESVHRRQFGSVIRLSVPNTISPAMLQRLISELEVDPDRDVYSIPGAMGSASLFELTSVDRPDLKYTPYVPRFPEPLPQGTDLFSMIAKNDILLHLPYDSFKPVEEFFHSAAHDPRVLAIKATLYRVGKNSPIVQSLLNARENGKQVTVLVELKARFDEENNLEWARALEHRGVHVTYGVEELPVKTHAKIALVIRRETSGLQRYVHLGTGNYNAATARLYTDLGLFTSDPEICEDASRLFNRLTGYAPETAYNRLLVAPEYLHPTILELIDHEIQAALDGKPARLVFKMNQLEEEVVIQRLYQASQAGVQIDLIVRGICCLRPRIPGMSENIRVRSILGRYLEHPRIYYFQNAPQDQQLYAGSADLMRRNLYNRVETVFPILDSRLRQKVRRILATDLCTNQRVWIMQPDGIYQRVQLQEGAEQIDSQQVFMHDSAGLDIDLL